MLKAHSKDGTSRASSAIYYSITHANEACEGTQRAGAAGGNGTVTGSGQNAVRSTAHAIQHSMQI